MIGLILCFAGGGVFLLITYSDLWSGESWGFFLRLFIFQIPSIVVALIGVLFALTGLSKAQEKEEWKTHAETLIKTLNDDEEDINARRNAVLSLGKIKNETVVKILIEKLSDNDTTIRRNAIESLGKIGSIKAVEPLMKVLKDKDKFIQWGAIRALGKIGDERAVEVLNNTLNDERESIRKAAELALKKIKAKKTNDNIAGVSDQPKSSP
ncbi:MAG: HEAT repeat domain-containing protein [Candidatus Aminicenantaceae bacterium]